MYTGDVPVQLWGQQWGADRSQPMGRYGRELGAAREAPGVAGKWGAGLVNGSAMVSIP